MLVFRREIDVEQRIYDILARFRGQNFNGVTISEIVRQYDRGLGGRRADLAVLKDDGLPLLLIETKKKYESRGFRAERRFVVTSEEVLGQVFAYAALLKRSGVYVPFVAAANDRQIVVFAVPEDIDRQVNWEAVDNRDYGNVLRRGYIYDVLRPGYLLVHKQIRFTEDFFAELLETITGIYKKKYRFEERRQELHCVLIEDFRGFVDFITPFILDAIVPGGRYREDMAKLVEDYARERGYGPTPEQLARQMAYVLLNKILFYKVLERYYSLKPLRPLYMNREVRTVNEYLQKLRELFNTAVKVTGDFERIFVTGIYDNVEIQESEEVLKAFDWLIGLIDAYRVERLGDVVGYVYEELIPAEERHVLGQFYTPKPIAELIVKWSVRSPDDKVLDPGCGSGTFLVEAYKRLAELKLRRPFNDIIYVPRDVHEQILGQLYGVDINEFPAHLTAMNLAMRNPRAPSTNTMILVKDYFTIRPGQSVLAPYYVRTVEGERPAEVVFGNFDAVVGNPPYTRWTEIPRRTQDEISKLYKEVLSNYSLTPRVVRGVEPGIYVYWIIHSTGFLRDGGRLGMIISDSWLQTLYGVGFLKFLADNFRIRAIIDMEARVFPVPLVGACIVLLERERRAEERRRNNVVFMLLRPRKALDVDYVLKLVEEYSAKPGAELVTDEVVLRVVSQEEVYELEERPITLLYNTETVVKKIEKNEFITRLSQYFEISRGSTLWNIWAIRHRRGPDVGGNEFFYLSESEVEQLGLPRECLYRLLPSPRYAKFFTFNQDDWEAICRNGADCWLFLCHRPRNELPENVRRYIEMGEGPNATIRLRRRPGEEQGRPVSESAASRVRRRHRSLFFDWYDLGGVVNVPIFVTYYARYKHRFILANFDVALDADLIALIPQPNVQFDLTELKALLAFLNSSFGQLQTEIKGRPAGGVAVLGLDVASLREFLVLDVKRLPRDVVNKFADLFDRLEAEARRLGGVDSAENFFGSKLARELTGRTNIREGVEGLFNTVIKEIDYEMGRILGFDESEVELVRSVALDLARRRLSRAGEAVPEALKESEGLC